jgi:exonuclease SbcD
LRTVRGTVPELARLADTVGDDHLRVYVREPARAGLREEVLGLLPHALEVRIEPEFAAAAIGSRPAIPGGGVERAPGELFAEFCADRRVADPRVAALFGRLHDEVTGSDADSGADSGVGAGG